MNKKKLNANKNCKQCIENVKDKDTGEERQCFKFAACKTLSSEYCNVHARNRKPTKLNIIQQQKVNQVPILYQNLPFQIEYWYITKKDIDNEQVKRFLSESYPIERYISMPLVTTINLNRQLQSVESSFQITSNMTTQIHEYISIHPDKVKTNKRDFGILFESYRFILGVDKIKNLLFGSFEVDIEFDKESEISFAYISYVWISIDYMGKDLCKSLFKAGCNLVVAHNKISYFKLKIISEYKDRAFRCYVKAGFDLNYKVYYTHYGKLPQQIISIDPVLIIKILQHTPTLFFLLPDTTFDDVDWTRWD